MNCPVDRLEAYLDEELDAAQATQVEQHLASCAECSAAMSRLRHQQQRVRTDAPYYSAPAGFDETIRQALRREASRETPWRWVAIAASLLLAASLAWNFAQLRLRTNTIAAEVLTGHLRSLLGDHLLDVPSSDRHTVKPWFAGKLDFSPDVKDLAAEGYPLAGGRLDYLDGRRVAVLAFHRRQHVINLFTWPSDSAAGAQSPLTRDGVHLLHWTAGGMTYWAASDVSAADLEQFAKLYRAPPQ